MRLGQHPLDKSEFLELWISVRLSQMQLQACTIRKSLKGGPPLVQQTKRLFNLE